MTLNPMLAPAPASTGLHRHLPAWVPRTNIAMFAVFFALWVLVDISLMRWLSRYAFLISAPLAMATILRPNTSWLFLATVAAQTWAWWLKMPFVVNAVIVGAFLSIVILTSAGLFLLRYRRLPDMAELEERLFPSFRIAVPLVWLFAALQKTNDHFFDPTISCAVLHYQHLRKYLPFLPSADVYPLVGHLAVWTAWCFEVAVPVLLLLALNRRFGRRFAIAGIVLALGFHFVMSLNWYQSFSILALTFYVPFLPNDFWRAVAAAIAGAYRRWKGFKWVVRLSAFGLMAFGLEMWLYSIGQVIDYARRWPGEGLPARAQGWLLITFFVYPVVMIGWAWLMRRRRDPGYPLSPGRVPAWAYLAFALITFNGLCPYLGLKTENSFAMFSNLLTEGEHWNHSFLPRSMRVFGWQDNMVTVHEVSLPGRSIEQLRAQTDDLGWLADLSDGRFRVVEFEFRRLAAGACRKYKQPISITYDINGGERVRVPNAHDVPYLTGDNPYWAGKLMMFRWTPNNPRGICLH